MKIVMLILLSGLLVACGVADDVITIGDDVIRLYGDDILRTASNNTKFFGSGVGDDFALLLKGNWDEVVDGAVAARPALIYQTGLKYSSVQQNVLQSIGSTYELSPEDALLYFQSMCNVVSYVKLFRDYPPEQDLLTYLTASFIKPNPKLQTTAEVTASVEKFSRALIAGTGEATPEAGAEIILNGLCLVTELD